MRWLYTLQCEIFDMVFYKHKLQDYSIWVEWVVSGCGIYCLLVWSEAVRK